MHQHNITLEMHIDGLKSHPDLVLRPVDANPSPPQPGELGRRNTSSSDDSDSMVPSDCEDAPSGLSG